MSQNCLKFCDKFETKLRTDLRPYRDKFETYLTILLLRANWEIFETWVHSESGHFLQCCPLKCNSKSIMIEKKRKLSFFISTSGMSIQFA